MSRGRTWILLDPQKVSQCPIIYVGMQGRKNEEMTRQTFCYFVRTELSLNKVDAVIDRSTPSNQRQHVSRYKISNIYKLQLETAP